MIHCGLCWAAPMFPIPVLRATSIDVRKTRYRLVVRASPLHVAPKPLAAKLGLNTASRARGTVRRKNAHAHPRHRSERVFSRAAATLDAYLRTLLRRSCSRLRNVQTGHCRGREVGERLRCPEGR